MNLSEEQLESLLTTQNWIEPSANFTQLVMHRVSLEPVLQAAPAVESRRAKWADRVLTATPFAAVAGVLGYHSRTLGTLAINYLNDAGVWLNTTTGWAIFGSYPVMIFGIVAPLMAGAVASCALSGRCRLTSA
jgi:hypothetical protein